MTISIWRYSHLALAVSSFVLLVLASVTGIILAFQPVAEKLQPFRAATFENSSLADVIPALHQRYPGITQINVDANKFVLVKGTDRDGNELSAYVDPTTGDLLGTPPDNNDFFQWVTALHRSLFIHETGRFFIGITAFLLMLITISGTILVIQRQRGIKRFFTKIVRENFAQYYHVVLGRLALIPIFIIALSGTYLSLERFGLVGTATNPAEVDFDAIRSQPAKAPSEFDVFKNTKLSAVRTIDFPFSEDVEDYYTLKLSDRELAVNQITGDVLSEEIYPVTVFLTNFSLDLHTGRSSALWAIILAAATTNILFFIYSGFVIMFKRRTKPAKNNYGAKESNIIILVGSENGSTFRFAQSIHQQLTTQNKRSFIAELNDYQSFPAAEQLIIITATYGLGDAPTNAAKFTDLVGKLPQQHSIQYSVLGFGSRSYPDFCRFAFEVNHLLAQQPWARQLTDIHTVSDKSPDELNLWTEAWSQQAGVQVTAPTDPTQVQAKDFETLVVSHNSISGNDETFTVRFQSRKRLEVSSGDLLAIYPNNDHRERMYSIGVVNKEIQLSVRLYPGGLGSEFLRQLSAGQKIRARVVSNKHFHLPQQASSIIMICNGTGIAPFLGMLSENTRGIHCELYCGFRDDASFDHHRAFLDEQIAAGRLNTVNKALSREGEKQYVSALISRDATVIAATLKNGGTIMICGSLSMQKDVIDLLNRICLEKIGKGVSWFQAHGYVRTDCY